MLFVFATCRAHNLAENQTNLAGNQKEFGSTEPVEPAFFKSALVLNWLQNCVMVPGACSLCSHLCWFLVLSLVLLPGAAPWCSTLAILTLVHLAVQYCCVIHIAVATNTHFIPAYLTEQVGWSATCRGKTKFQSCFFPITTSLLELSPNLPFAVKPQILTITSTIVFDLKGITSRIVCSVNKFYMHTSF